MSDILYNNNYFLNCFLDKYIDSQRDTRLNTVNNCKLYGLMDDTMYNNTKKLYYELDDKTQYYIFNDTFYKDSEDKYFIIGTKTHAMGLIIYNEYFIITNSGIGVNFHQKEPNTNIIDEYKQNKYNLILKFNYDKNYIYILNKLLKETDTIYELYEQIFKYYYYIKIESKKDDIIKNIKDFISSLEIDKTIIKDVITGTYYINESDNKFTTETILDEYFDIHINFFIDLLFHEYKIHDNNKIIFEKNYKYMMSTKYDNTTDIYIKNIKNLLNIKSFYVLECDKPIYFEAQYSESCTFYSSFLCYLYMECDKNKSLIDQTKYDEYLNKIKIKILQYEINKDNPKYTYRDKYILKLLNDIKDYNLNLEVNTKIRELYNKYINTISIEDMYKLELIISNYNFEYDKFEIILNKREPITIDEIIDFIDKNIIFIDHNIIYYEKYIFLELIKKNNNINYDDNYDQLIDIKYTHKYKNVIPLFIYLLFKIIEKSNIFTEINILQTIYYYNYVSNCSFLDHIKLHIIDKELKDFIDTIHNYQVIIITENTFYFILKSFNNNEELTNDKIEDIYTNYMRNKFIKCLYELLNIFINNTKIKKVNSNYLLFNIIDNTNYLNKLSEFRKKHKDKINVNKTNVNYIFLNGLYSIIYIYKKNNITYRISYHCSFTEYSDIFISIQNLCEYIKKFEYIYYNFDTNIEKIIYDFDKINNFIDEGKKNELIIYMNNFDYSYYLSVNIKKEELKDYHIIRNNIYCFFNIISLFEYYKLKYDNFKEKISIFNNDNKIADIITKFEILFNESKITQDKNEYLKINEDIIFPIKNEQNIIKYNNDIDIKYNTNIDTKKLYFGKYQIYQKDEFNNNSNVFINNLLEYTKYIKNFLYIGLNDRENPTSGIILFNKNFDYKTIFTNDSSFPSFKFIDESNNNLYYIEFINDHFKSIIPNIENNYFNFLIFTTHLLINFKYELFNLLLSYIIEADLILNIDYCNEIINKEYIPSPYRWYFLNKLYYILNGKFDQDIAYNFGIRKEYYIELYKKYDIKPTIKDNKTFELKYYKKWIDYITKIDKKKYDKNEIKTKFKELFDNDFKSDLKQFDIKLKDVIEYNNLIDYIYKNYNELQINLQYNILKKIEKILDNTSLQNNEIIGNIKYYIQETFLDFEEYKKDIYSINIYIHLFCIITGKIIDKIQYETIYYLFEDNKNMKYKLYELLMGRGKTQVIIPCTVFILLMSKKYYNIFICMPSHLIYQSLNIFRELSPFFIDSYIFNITINRNKEDTIFFKKHIMNTTYKVILLTDTYIKSYLLNTKEFELDNHNITYSDIDYLHNITEIKTTIQKNNPNINSNINMLKDRSFILFDEFDMLIDPIKSSLNYPVGIQSNLYQQTILVNIISKICYELFKNYNRFMKESDKSDNDKNTKLIKHIMINIEDTYYKDALSKLEDKNYEQFNEEKFTDDAYYMVGGSLQSLLLYYIKCIYNTFKSCLNMMINLHYGLDNNIFLAIPYISQNTPIKGSQFSDPIVQIILTFIYYLTKGFRDNNCDSIKLISHCRKILEITNKDISELLDIINYIKQNNEKKLTESINNIKDIDFDIYFKYINYYLTKVIFPEYIKINEEYYNCSLIDIIDPNFIANKFALSGTVNVYLTNFNTDKFIIENIKSDEFTKKEIEKALISTNYSGHKSNIYKYENSKNIIDYIIYLMKEYQVLIDVGSFLRHYDNITVAEKLYNEYKELVVFFDKNDNKLIYNNGTIESFKNIKNNKDIKIYFDQKHTVGTDIDIHSNAKSLLTINSNNTYTQVVQGLYRMREINYYQINDYIIKKEDITNVNTIEQIIEYIKRKEENYFKNTYSIFSKQSLLCLIRKKKLYHKNSYLFKPFIPTMELPETIFNDYNYNYEEQYFYKFIKELLQ